jgi:DtxR family Mn-dependent transcriptional regulator
MEFSELSQPALDYLKAIWSISDTTGSPATVKAVASRKSLSPSTVSTMIKRLESLGLVGHARYGVIELTDDGRRLALEMVRRHRLLETYLVLHLGYAWDEVQFEARALAHAVSETFVERLDALLGHPRFDPHGDPIPTARGAIPGRKSVALVDVASGSEVSIERIVDAHPEFLRFLAAHGVGIGTRALVMSLERSAGVVNLLIAPDDGGGPNSVSLSLTAAESIRVSRAN